MDRGPVHWILGGLAFRLREFEFDDAVSFADTETAHYILHW